MLEVAVIRRGGGVEQDELANLDGGVRLYFYHRIRRLRCGSDSDTGFQALPPPNY